jgi:alpha,alpha-trehalose phosphorylase
MLTAADCVNRHSERAWRLGVDDEETAAWREAAANIHIPYDDELGVHPQVEGFTRYQEWDFDNTPPESYPLLLNFPYFDLYRRQVVKQADLVLAMHWCGDAFTPEQKLRNFDYYERRTVRDSSLSSCTQSVVAAEVGYLELAHDYLGEAALMDLHDIHNNTREGLHIAALAGAWLGLVAGFGGMRDHEEQLTFVPRLPARISRLEFALMWRGMRLRVDVRQHEAIYSLRNGAADSSLDFTHHGEAVTVTTEKEVRMPIPHLEPHRRQPRQPAGRAPARRPAPDVRRR